MSVYHKSKYPEITLGMTNERFSKDEIVIENHLVIRIVSGEMKVILADQTHVFCPGDTVMIPRNQLMSIIKYPKDGRPYKSIAIALLQPRLKEFYAKNGMSPSLGHRHQLRIFEPNTLLESFFNSLMPFFEPDTQLPEALVSIKIEEALSILRFIDPEIDDFLSNFLDPDKINLADFMEKNYLFNMPLERFGYLTGRSLSTFNRDFRKAFAMTPQKWLTLKRLEFAHFQLSDRGRKPVEVYLEAGFENLSHFSFAFKKLYGYAPSEIPEEKRRDRMSKANLAF